jgi:hypothetical protein|tara:strand:- start:73 stop:627 length:555 start_codon:yes stop_codon:yes gene_type:complete
MESNNSLVQPIYRYKFSEIFKRNIFNFAQTNKHVEDKEEWDVNFDRWKRQNIQYILEEQRRLSNMGFNGDIQLKQGKIYKSARYYFKNKEINNDKKPKKRRVYVSLDRSVLNIIDEDIANIMNTKEKTIGKPHNAYTKFIKNCYYTNVINVEKERLLTKNLEAKEIDDKIKKTYKNRYYNALHQ